MWGRMCSLFSKHLTSPLGFLPGGPYIFLSCISLCCFVLCMCLVSCWLLLVMFTRICHYPIYDYDMDYGWYYCFIYKFSSPEQTNYLSSNLAQVIIRQPSFMCTKGN